VCSEYQIGQSQYYQWRDKFLAEAHHVFEGKRNGSEVERLRQKTARLQQIIGALTVELKKSEAELL
jgi:transposase-like protein